MQEVRAVSAMRHACSLHVRMIDLDIPQISLKSREQEASSFLSAAPLLESTQRGKREKKKERRERRKRERKKEKRGKKEMTD